MAIAYPISQDGEKFFWVSRFVPIDGKFSIVIICGDHGNDTYIKEDFVFNPNSKSYELVNSETKPCE